MTNRAATLRPSAPTFNTIVARDKRRADEALATLRAVSEGYETQAGANALSLLTHMSGLDAASATTTGAMAHLRRAASQDPNLAGLTSQAAMIQALWALIGLASDHYGPSSAATQTAWRLAGAIYRQTAACGGEDIMADRVARMLEGLARCSEA